MILRAKTNMQTYNGYAYKIKSYVISYDLGPKQLLLHQYKVKLFTLRGGRGNQKRQRIEVGKTEFL